jgi:radical SAM protein with 4Fe4S-binding SPASM domain
MSCGITIEENKPTKYYIDYIDFLVKNIYGVENFRLSIAFPGEASQKNNFYFIKNFDLGDKLVKIIQKLVSKGIPTNLDCIIFPCMFKNKEFFKYVEKFTAKVKTVCGGPGQSAPSDIFPDGKVIYCYPTREAISSDINNFHSSEELISDLNLKYQIIKSTLEYPEECQNCPFFNKECHGPCLGFFDLSDKKGMFDE